MNLITRRDFGLGLGIASLAALAPLGLRNAYAEPPPGPLVSSDWLKSQLGSPDLAIIELRGNPGTFAGQHIPGAAASAYPGGWQVDRDGIPWSRPTPEQAAVLIGGLGISDGSNVVLVPMGTDATELGVATWPYWLLRYYGHAGVALLNGGLSGWLAEPSNPRVEEVHGPLSATFAPRPDESILITTAEVAARLGSPTLIIDARSPEQYAGDSRSALVVRAGHIPGAVNLPFSAVYDSDRNRVRPVEELERIVAPFALDREAEIIVYCNTGHWSSIVWFALHELLGYRNAVLYEDSMAGWSREPTLPLRLGSTP